MGSAKVALSVVCCSIALLGLAQSQNPRTASTPPDCCGILSGALKDFEQIKPGMTRREIEQHFRLDGGGQFRENTRYVYPECHEVDIKVDVDFKSAPPVDGVDDSPDDTVVKVSKPYLEYPFVD